jgi:hypothetical protein
MVQSKRAAAPSTHWPVRSSRRAAGIGNVEKEAMAWSLRVGCMLQAEECTKWASVGSCVGKGNSPKMRSHRQVCAMPAPNDTHFEGDRDI